MTLPGPLDLIAYLLILMFAFPVHEFAHAWVADRFGDPQPRLDGRLTLDPTVHLDLLGSILLLIVGFGWARPVRITPHILRRRSQAAVMWVSLAGPASNLLLAVIAAVPFRLGWLPVIWVPVDGVQTNLLEQIFLIFIYTNLLLMVFNLIPLAPLDGEKIIGYFLPPELASRLEQINQYGQIILFALFFIGPRFGLDFISPIVVPLTRFLVGWG